MTAIKCDLVLEGLTELEYVESGNPSVQVGTDGEVTLFPSLEKLRLWHMPKLKGWWKTSSESGFLWNTYSFCQLSHLTVNFCRNLTTFPLCPNVEDLELQRFNGALGPIMWADGEGQGQGRLKTAFIDNVGYLNSLPIRSFHHLSFLEINYDSKIERLGIGEVREVFRSSRLSSLRSLQIWKCEKLKGISGRGVWEHFTALETLKLRWLPELELEDEDDDVNNNISSGCTRDSEMQPWRYLAPTLRSFTLQQLPKLVKLPNGMHHLTAIHSLEISFCNNLEALPPWIGCLSSLQSLTIFYCEEMKSLPEEMYHLTSLTELDLRGCSLELTERCRPPTGADCHKIKHVSCIQLTD